MSRSVSTHRHSVQTVYLHPEFDEADWDFAWSDFLDDIRYNVLPEIFPSMTKADRWLDREDHIVAENCHAEVSVSVYCGLVAVCLAPLDPDDAFKVAWCERMADTFRAKLHKMFPDSSLASMGSCSNGEQIFSRVNKPGALVSSSDPAVAEIFG